MAEPVLVRTIANACVHQPLKDVLQHMLSLSLATRNVGTVTASDTGLRISTTASYTVNGQLIGKTASSAVWALTNFNVPATYVAKCALLLNASGTGSIVAGTPVTSAAYSTSTAAAKLPDYDPASYCCVGYLTINNAAGTAAFTGATTTFSQCVSAGGSVGITEIVGMPTS